MPKELEYIIKKFPDHRAMIIILYNKDEDFRSLCEDYYTSAVLLEEKRLTAINDRDIENEYSKVYVDLEKEITRLLGTKKK